MIPQQQQYNTMILVYIFSIFIFISHQAEPDKCKGPSRKLLIFFYNFLFYVSPIILYKEIVAKSF